MFCILLDVELTNNNVIKELAVFIDGKIQGYSFCPPKKYKPRKQAFRCTRNLHGNVWNSGRLEYSRLSNIFPRAVKGECFAKKQKKAKFKILGNLLDIGLENLESHGYPKVQDLVDEEV